MGRRGGPPPGVRFLVLGLALPAMLCAAGCADPAGSSTAPAGSPRPVGSPAGPGGPPRPTGSPVGPSAGSPTGSPVDPSAGSSVDSSADPAPTSDAALCARLIAHWAREALDGDTYGDYQSMGLSHGQYEILMRVVDAGRAARRRQGVSAAEELMDRQARTACAARYRHGAPTGSPWS
ncbi:hypothetical protein ACF1GT_08290 [Streptomyces sp. NPDC014636]|uniref:hypothetical protein n=1 Tax=Streptomyces sp. NPDC014636 TaxID=3364876 RepID=UPI0036F872BB